MDRFPLATRRTLVRSIVAQLKAGAHDAFSGPPSNVAWCLDTLSHVWHLPFDCVDDVEDCQSAAALYRAWLTHRASQLAGSGPGGSDGGSAEGSAGSAASAPGFAEQEQHFFCCLLQHYPPLFASRWLPAGPGLRTADHVALCTSTLYTLLDVSRACIGQAVFSRSTVRALLGCIIDCVAELMMWSLPEGVYFFSLFTVVVFFTVCL